MPVTAATREALQFHYGAASLQDDPKAYLEKDFSTLLETQAIGSGIRLTSENRDVKSGLEVADWRLSGNVPGGGGDGPRARVGSRGLYRGGGSSWEGHRSKLQYQMPISFAVLCLKNKKNVDAQNRQR